MTKVIRNASAADLLAALPAVIDRDPGGSVVLVSFRGKRTHATLRLDIPRSGYKRFSTTALGLISRIESADDVVPLIWSDTPLAGHAELLATLVQRFQQAGYAVRDALVVGSDGWASHYDPTEHPLAEIDSARERLGIESPGELPGRVAEADEGARARLRYELTGIRMLVEECTDLHVLDPLHDLPYFVEGALDCSPSQLDDQAALLLFALQGPPARDLAMLQWAFGLEWGDAMFDAESAGADVHVHASELMLGHGGGPSTERVERAIAVLTRLISLADDADKPAPLCMLAWLNWARGRGSTAGVHIDHARQIDPSYGMAQLLDTLFSSGTMPEWIFSTPADR